MVIVKNHPLELLKRAASIRQTRAADWRINASWLKNCTSSSYPASGAACKGVTPFAFCTFSCAFAPTSMPAIAMCPLERAMWRGMCLSPSALAARSNSTTAEWPFAQARWIGERPLFVCTLGGALHSRSLSRTLAHHSTQDAAPCTLAERTSCRRSAR